MAIYAYVSISEEDRVSIWKMDPDTGKLDAAGSVAVSGRPAPLATDPERRFLFVGRRTDLELSSYQIDHGTGALSPVGSVSLDSDPCYLNTDRRGNFLLSAYYFAGMVTVHRIGDYGATGTPPVVSLKTASGAHSMQTDPTNRFAFVPHIAGGNGPNAIFQFRFDEATGSIEPNSPATLTPEAEAGPRHFCFHPSKDILYFSNEQGCSVTAYNLDTATGTLSAFQTVPTLPDGFEGRNSCAQIQISPSGRSLYAPNRGHNSIACFSIDDSGHLTPIGHVPAEPVPRAVSLDPQGRFFFAAGLESGRLTSYRVDQDTGGLEQLEVYDVGKGPMWVLVADLGD